MSKDLTIFDPDKLKTELRKKVRSEFVAMIPKQKWDEFVTQTILEFEEKELKPLVKEECKKIIQQRLGKLSGAQWDEYGLEQVDEELGKILVKAAPQMIQSMMGNVSRSMIQQMKQNSQYL